MVNKWLQHLANFRSKNTDIDPKDIMKQARKSYRGGNVTPYEPTNLASSASKISGGGVSAFDQRNLATTASSVSGGRRTRRSSRTSRATRTSRRSKRSRRR